MQCGCSLDIVCWASGGKLLISRILRILMMQSIYLILEVAFCPGILDFRDVEAIASLWKPWGTFQYNRNTTSVVLKLTCCLLPCQGTLLLKLLLQCRDDRHVAFCHVRGPCCWSYCSSVEGIDMLPFAMSWDRAVIAIAPVQRGLLNVSRVTGTINV